MSGRMWMGLVAIAAVLGAGFLFWPEEPADSAIADTEAADEEPAVPRRPAPRPVPGSEYRAPDVAAPLPKRTAEGLGGRLRRGEGVRAATPAHDFHQEYEPTARSVEQAVQARAHRIRACADVHGVPTAPPPFPVENEEELESSVAVVVDVGDGPELGQVELLINGAAPGLTDCLQQAVSDMMVRTPGAAGLTTQVLIPLDTEDDLAE